MEYLGNSQQYNHTGQGWVLPRGINLIVNTQETQICDTQLQNSYSRK